MTGAFDRLAPFVQEFIWKHRWTELREIQARATAAAFETDNHILLAAGTASGKTEAAFLPILTQLYEDPSSSVGAMYIGPLKALINDQFLRLGDLCVDANIAVTAWHGDVAASKKRALLKKPTGILQITPEALEGLLLNRGADLSRLFGDLRWIVIDEVHAFMASDRGGQVLALLDRLRRYAVNPARLPRRMGLSATLGDYAEAAAWLDGATNRGVEVIAEQTGRTVYLLVDTFQLGSALPDDGTDARDLSNEDPLLGRLAQAATVSPRVLTDNDVADKLIARQTDLFRAAYEQTQGRKSLIFTNRRADAEEIITGLRRLAERDRAPDIYHVHHGSIAAPLREAAEMAMRDGEGPACTAATVTLELGIDLGQLDRVLQLGPTFSVASFLQRLGRSGRRGQRPEMFFLLREVVDRKDESVMDRIPWELLQTIALIQLYAEEKWIEPLARPTLPGSLLYHQTMSVIGAAGELTPPQLAERVLTLAPFLNVSEDDFRDLLVYLLETDQLERTEEGGLILGLAGERVVRNFRFLATFQDVTEWSVKEGTRDIGTIGSPVPEGERFALAGRTWEVIQLVADQRIMIVKRVRGGLRTMFLGGQGGDIHDRVVDRMRRVLEEDAVYPYLTERAASRLAEVRQLARVGGLSNGAAIIALGGNRLALLPWCGTRKLRTMALMVGKCGTVKGALARGFHLEITPAIGDISGIVGDLTELASQQFDGTALVNDLDRILCERAKYDEYLPETLLKRAFVADHLDVEGAARCLLSAMRARPIGSNC